MKADWKFRLRVFTAKYMIKFGKLTHSDYTVEELQEIIDDHLPVSFAVDVPISQGELTLLEGKIAIPNDANAMNIELLGSIVIGPIGKPIYRAHLLFKLALFPMYVEASKTVKLEKMLIEDVQLVNDKYSILETSKDLLSLLLPKTIQNLFTGTVKSAVGILTGGVSDIAGDYMQLYLTGSKQKILDYHRPQIEALVQAFAQSEELQYQMGLEDFEEHLFNRYGKEVLVEDGFLRFKF
jgi:hypothetical protein